MTQLFIAAAFVAAVFLFLGWLIWFVIRQGRRHEQWQLGEFALGHHIARWTYDRERWNQFQRLNRLSSLKETLIYGAAGFAIGAFVWAISENLPWFLPWVIIPGLSAFLGPFKAAIRNRQFGTFCEPAAELQIGLEGMNINGNYKPLAFLKTTRIARRQGIDCLHLYFSSYKYDEDLWLPLPPGDLLNPADLAQLLNSRFQVDTPAPGNDG